VDSETADVVGVRLERRDLLAGRDVVHAELEVVRARDEPVLASNVLDATDGHVGDFERLDVGLRLIVPDLDLTIAAEVRGRSHALQTPTTAPDAMATH
jgi:Ethanolamine utilization protein EutJ (predicted chaperonin)